MQPRIIDIFRNAGDDNLGQTLIRLARAAAAQHDRQGPVPNGLDRDAPFNPHSIDHDDARALHKEVDA